MHILIGEHDDRQGRVSSAQRAIKCDRRLVLIRVLCTRLLATQTNGHSTSQATSAKVIAPMFYTAASSINGIGAFATAEIPRGCLIHQERPFLYLCSNEYPVPPPDPQERRWQTWLRLRPKGTSLPEIFRTTSLRCGVTRRGTRQVETSGVFLQAARFNSSCQPNVHAHWNQLNGYMDFRALRDITADEELCVCYDPRTLLYSSAERQQRLLARFGFSCRCPPCSQANPDSDQRRTDLRTIIEAGVPSLGVQAVSTSHSIENNQTDDEKALNSINEITGAIGDLHAEGIYNYADTLHFDLHTARKQAGQFSDAMFCLLTARNLTSMMVGSDDPRVGQMTAKLPFGLRDDDGLTCCAEGCRVGESLDNSLPPDGL